jgi:hypothetical protein
MMNTPCRMKWFGYTILGLLLIGGRVGSVQGAAAPEKAKPPTAGEPAAKPAAPAPAAEKAPAPAKAAVNEKPAQPEAAAPARPAPARGPFRPLAPGAMKTIDSMRQVEETVSRHDLVELLASNPALDWAKNVPFRREIWALQFRCKPMRMIFVDLPQPSGMMQRKQIWYMIYSVTNAGKTMRPIPKEGSAEGEFDVEYIDKPIRFVPSLLLYCPQLDKSYPDRVIPAAMGPIRTREDPNRTFFNSIEIVRDIQVGETVWGVATWEDIDPRTDRFSVFVGGLTNAYRWSDEAGKFKPGSPLGTGRRLQRKTLKLNFWRPGDEFDPKEREIRFGVPGEVDYEWVYR